MIIKFAVTQVNKDFIAQFIMLNSFITFQFVINIIASSYLYLKITFFFKKSWEIIIDILIIIFITVRDF